VKEHTARVAAGLEPEVLGVTTRAALERERRRAGDRRTPTRGRRRQRRERAPERRQHRRAEGSVPHERCSCSSAPKRPADNVLAAIMAAHWAILPDALATIVSIAERTNISPEALEAQRGERSRTRTR
jgi:hypothetical protein